MLEIEVSGEGIPWCTHASVCVSFVFPEALRSVYRVGKQKQGRKIKLELLILHRLTLTKFSYQLSLQRPAKA